MCNETVILMWLINGPWTQFRQRSSKCSGFSVLWGKLKVALLPQKIESSFTKSINDKELLKMYYFLCYFFNRNHFWAKEIISKWRDFCQWLWSGRCQSQRKHLQSCLLTKKMILLISPSFVNFPPFFILSCFWKIACLIRKKWISVSKFSNLHGSELHLDSYLTI